MPVGVDFDTSGAKRLMVSLLALSRQKLRHYMFLHVAIILSFFLPTTSFGWTHYYYWEDERGIVNLSNNFGKIPPDYRDKVKIITPRGRSIGLFMSNINREAGGRETNVETQEAGDAVEGSTVADREKRIGSREGPGEREDSKDVIIRKQIERYREMLGATDRDEVRESLRAAIRQKEEELRAWKVPEAK